MWEHRTIPTNLVWTILILIPKGNVDTRGIRLLEVLYNVMEAIIDKYIKKSVKFYDVIHGCTAIKELKLAQKLANVDQDPLFLVFLDLINVYYNLDHGRLFKTLDGYSAGPKMRGILVEL